MKWCWLFAFTLAGCAGPLGALKVQTPLLLEGQSFVLRSHETSPPADAAQVAQAIAKASSGLARWGGLSEPVTVFVVKNHDDLETAVRRSGFSWLRAWGRYDEVIFQTPSTWTTKEDFVNQLVLHELTHCLLFQRSGTRATWFLKDIPLWFREGMAVATAGPAGLYPSLEDSALWLQRNPTLDAFKNGEALSEGQSSAVYGVALHAFTYLVEKHGEPCVEALMAAMRGGSNFDQAFNEVIGVPVEKFQKDFEAWLTLRNFRRSPTSPHRR